MPFFIDGNPTPSEVSEAVNYLLANLSPNTPAGSFAVNNNTTTGFITNTPGNLIQFQYRYLDIKYADSVAGLNFSDNPYSRTYFGLYNSDTVSESTNPADYTWFQVTGGFGATKVLWIVTAGGRHANFSVSQEAPDQNQNWQVVPVRSVDLDNPFAIFNQYMSVKFATNSVGTTGFGDTITNATYYGVATTTDGTTPTDPSLYEWSPFAFGTTYNLYYRCWGGRNISFIPAVSNPIGYIKYTPGSVLNIDVATLAPTTDLGIVSTSPLLIQSPYRYLLVRYADSANGSGITNDPTGKTYFGLQASEVLTFDNNPNDYVWFSAGGTFLATVALWVRTSGNSTALFSFALDAPDSSGWQNITDQTVVLDPYIDVYARSGTVVVNVSSPTSGRIGYSNVGHDGIVNLNLDPFGQGSGTGGFTINPSSTSTIVVDQFGRVQQAVPVDQVRFSSMLTHATAGQTVFTFSNSQPDQIMVFRNGCFLVPGTDYTRTSTAVTFANACTLNDVIAIYYIRLIDASTSADKVPFTTTTITLTNGQTVIPATYIDGSEVLFINGAMIVDTDYSYTGTNQGYTLGTPSTGGTLSIVVFAKNNGNALIFGENFTSTTYSSSNVVFPTQFYRNSHLMFFCGTLLRPGTDYTMAGSSALVYSYTLIGGLSFSGQPSQFISFNSSGEASTSSLSSAGVLGMDFPVVIEREPSMLEMFNEMKKEINKLKREINKLKGQK
jgi:hypothetical protein